jgi:hypothetical protein
MTIDEATELRDDLDRAIEQACNPEAEATA